MDVQEENYMHPDFPRWYRGLELGDDLARRQARWEGISTLAKRADFALVEALIRLSFKTRQPASPPSVQLMRDVFRDADDTFEKQGNDREIQVLAGASLAVIMCESTDIASLTALAVTTTSLAGGRRVDLPMDLGVIAEDALLRLSASNRQRPDLTTYGKGTNAAFDFKTAAAKVRETQNWDGVAEAFVLAGESTRSALARFILTQDEELQMLWWLIGQRSSAYDCRFDEVPVLAQPLVLSSELADITDILPGPPSVKALLSRAGLKESAEITIPTAVNAAKPEWLRNWIGESTPSPVTMPLHDAIRRQLETGAGDDWIAGWAATTAISASLALPVLTLGTLFYRERLLHSFS